MKRILVILVLAIAASSLALVQKVDKKTPQGSRPQSAQPGIVPAAASNEDLPPANFDLPPANFQEGAKGFNNSSQKILTAEDSINEQKTGVIDRDSGTEETEEKTFVIEISPKLPPYLFRLIPNQNVGRIEISKVGSSSILQTIEVMSGTGGYQTFTTQDINFDGYLDIAVLKEFGGKWYRLQYWLYDPASGLFINNALSKELTDSLHGTEIYTDSQKQEIYVDYMGPCPASHDTYQIINGHLLHTKSIEWCVTGRIGKKKCCYKLTAARRVGGEMVQVGEWTETMYGYGDCDWPLNYKEMKDRYPGLCEKIEALVELETKN